MPPGEQPTVFRPGGVSYLRIPAPEPGGDAAFYRAVFGWDIHGNPERPGFADATGHVIGHFMPDLPVAKDGGIRPYIYVDSVQDTLARVLDHGGSVAEEPYPEGDLTVATFRDPAGNVIGVWQRGAPS